MKKRRIRKLKILLEEYFHSYTIMGSGPDIIDKKFPELIFKQTLLKKLECILKNV